MMVKLKKSINEHVVKTGNVVETKSVFINKHVCLLDM